MYRHNYLLEFTAAKAATDVTVALYTTNDAGVVLTGKTRVNVYPRPLLEWIAGSGKHKLAVTAMPEAFFAIEQSHDLSTWTVIHRSQSDQTGVDIMPRPPLRPSRCFPGPYSPGNDREMLLRQANSDGAWGCAFASTIHQPSALVKCSG